MLNFAVSVRRWSLAQLEVPRGLGPTLKILISTTTCQ